MVDYPGNEVGLLSQNVLELTINQANALSNNGWETIDAFEGYSTKDIKEWMSTIAKVPITRGGCVYPMVRAKRVIALSFWVNHNILRGIVPDPNTFLAPVLQQALLDYPVHDDYIAAVDTADKPDKFSYEKWVDWQDSVITFLRNTKSVNRSIPLYYIIRKEPNPIDPTDMTEEDDIIYNAQHSGTAFNIDNKRVHTYLKELTNETVADQWINQHKRTQNGKGA